MRRLAAMPLAVAIACLLHAPGAAADTSGSAITDEEGVHHAVSIRIEVPSTAARPVSQRPHCQYTRMDYPSDATVTNLDGTPLAGDGTGNWFMLRCDDSLVRIIYLRPGSPAELADQARRYLPLPKPVPQFSPPIEQVVNLVTWLWIDDHRWHPLRSTVSVPGVSVSVTAVPELIEWIAGDGAVISCIGPAVPYDPRELHAQPTCAHTYRRSSAREPTGTFPAAVTIDWRVSWTAQGATGGGDLGSIETTTTTSVAVAEIQALNTSATLEVGR